ncbi:hypothetical protein SSIL_3378 [Solibacillus silvestris StLB046]|uniref:Uncharacterized protein n=1 Tax=Solibacillus silvestris (strain StLB046) TaxID=1002809 RepID=F2F403_SOLSS|nr:hypothetical protein SSIL_3378 [Solibacillus silvestris StLB046]
MSISNGEKLHIDTFLVKLLTNLCIVMHKYFLHFFTNAKIRYFMRFFHHVTLFISKKKFFSNNNELNT